MKAGCSILNMEEIQVAKASGCDYLELMGKYLTALKEEDYDILRRTLDKMQINCEGLNAYCPKEIIIAGPGYDRRRVREYAARCAARAEKLGINKVGIGSPQSRKLPEGYGRKRAEEEICDFLKTTADVFGTYGITVCLEPLAPCYCNFLNTLEEAAEIVDRIGWEEIRLVADFYNLEYVGEADADLSCFLPLLFHVHISDDEGSPDRRSCLKPERRSIHQTRIRHLYGQGYCGAVTLETDTPAEEKKVEQSLLIIRRAAFEGESIQEGK